MLSPILASRRRDRRARAAGTGRWISHFRNRVGIRAYKKAGFQECGRRRECRMMGGKLWDEIYMECLSTGFESPLLGPTFMHEP